MICIDCKNNPQVEGDEDIAMRHVVSYDMENLRTGKVIGDTLDIFQCDRCKRIDTN